jgi:hypothetical protein
LPAVNRMSGSARPGPEADWQRTTLPSHLPPRQRTTALEKWCGSPERPYWALC